ncbi:SpoIIE family protein phosphatase [Streptomyces sp. NPDC006879]|uniref:SpoIIE family protein phosphatase n=1 Tax=Streptomyces sp. NPDC006879 TaxID=3364767 RepID=UPI00369D988F
MSTPDMTGETGLPGPFDLSRAATAVLDDAGLVLGWSPTAETLLGHSDSEVMGRPLAALSAADTPPEVATDFDRRILDLRHRDGHTVRVTASLHRLCPPKDGPSRLLVMARTTQVEHWEAQQAMLRGLATQSPVGLAIYDQDLRVVWTNQALNVEMGPLQYAGIGPDDMVTHGVVLTEGYPDTLEAVMRDVLATGETVVELHYRGRPGVDPQRDHVWSCTYYQLHDAAGATLGVCEETVDITDRYLAQQRLDLLVRAGAGIGTTLDMAQTARELSTVAVPQFADEVTVDLLTAVLEGERPMPGAVPTGPMVRVWGPPTTLATRPSAPQGEGAELALPLRAEGAILGVVTFVWRLPFGPLDASERSVAEELVARTAVCIDNARRFTREHAAALMLQRSLLPRSLPRLSAVDLAHRYLPADSRAGVGGDWFDVIALSGTRVGLVVGDVVGHGLRAAATMGRIRTSVRALARLDLPPDELLSRLDDLVAQAANERSVTLIEGESVPEDEALGVTCLYAVYDPVTGACAMARAGHPLPAIVDPDSGAASFPELPAGPPLGLGGLPFESVEMTLPPGSLIAMYTDGLVRTRDRDLDDQLDTLRHVLADHTRPLNELCDRVVEMLQPSASDDDAAMLLVRTHVLGNHQVAVWDLTADPEMVASARAAVASQVTAWGLEELVFTTELVVSELVTNAIRYAPAGPIQLRLIRDQTLICEVSDSGHTTPHLRRAANDDEGGRGLFLIAQLTQQWGTRYTSTGKTIWAEQQPDAAGLPRLD